ncbi:MAG TPA: YdeI/OmpD-associated family protein [Acidimicrobiia bacterium]|nr:YdeI/OmpD-associated family protein [Acidimicrobiia bacterium]
MPDFEPDLPVRAFRDDRAFERWLEGNHDRSPGLWIKMAKRGSGIPSVTHAEALDVALCFGWIDGQRRALDGTHFLQRFTPRRPRSTWSRINRDKVAQLIATGRMRPSGLREVERAKADGRWDAAYAGQRSATVPEELQRLLDRNRRAREFFATLDSRNRYAFIFRVQQAKKPETRVRRAEQFVKMLAAGETFY